MVVCSVALACPPARCPTTPPETFYLGNQHYDADVDSHFGQGFSYGCVLLSQPDSYVSTSIVMLQKW